MAVNSNQRFQIALRAFCTQSYTCCYTRSDWITGNAPRAGIRPQRMTGISESTKRVAMSALLVDHSPLSGTGLANAPVQADAMSNPLESIREDRVSVGDRTMPGRDTARSIVNVGIDHTTKVESRADRWRCRVKPTIALRWRNELCGCQGIWETVVLGRKALIDAGIALCRQRHSGRDAHRILIPLNTLRLRPHG